jgi:hypothetical protein
VLGEHFCEREFPKIGHTKDMLARVHAWQVRLYSLDQRANCHPVINHRYFPGIVVTCNLISQMLKRFRVAQQFMPERDFELVAENPEIVKIAADGNDVALSLSSFVCRREPRYDAIRSNDLKYAQIFDNSGRGSKDRLVVDPSAAHLRVCRPEGNKVRVKVVVYVRSGVTAYRRQGY